MFLSGLLKISKIKRKAMKKTHDRDEIVRSFSVCLDGNGEQKGDIFGKILLHF
jgi:hypothetical protein